MSAASKFAIPVAFALLLISAPAESRVRAVLVGVSHYAGLPDELQLHGPRYDVEQYRELLLARGVAAADIVLLADGVASATDPTRQNILKALETIGNQVAPGDFVFMLFSGHGSQQPSKDDSRLEPDGLDEIFLPGDVAHWDSEAESVVNAITDNELSAAITRIRRHDAFVWAVFDACHSGSMTRGSAASGVQARQVSPEILRIDPDLMARARAAAAATQQRGARPASEGMVDATSAAKGGYLAFYAAQSSESAPEYHMPTVRSNYRGLFSYTLQQVLTEEPHATYRQVMERVLQEYRGISDVVPLPTPAYEGSFLDGVAFDAATSAPFIQWRVDNAEGALTLRAGLLQQINTGSILALFPTPVARDSELLGYFAVSNAGTVTSQLVPAAYNGRPPAALTASNASAYARPIEVKAGTALRVARPAKSANCAEPARGLTSAIALLETEKRQRLQWVAPDAGADVRLCMGERRLLFVDGVTRPQRGIASASAPGMDVADSSSDSFPHSFAAELGTRLMKIARVKDLLRTATVPAGAQQIRIGVSRTPACAAGCNNAPLVVTPTSRPSVKAGDRIRVEIANPLSQPVDVTVVYLDAAFGVSALFPTEHKEGCSPRILPGARTEFEFDITADPTGLERMLVMAAPMSSQTAELNLLEPLSDILADDECAAPRLAKRGGSDMGPAPIAAEMTTFGWTVVGK